MSTSQGWPSREPVMGRRLFVVGASAKMNENE
jgi:hypothetical protein